VHAYSGVHMQGRTTVDAVRSLIHAIQEAIIP
jgi:hypothetical protein